MKNPLAAYKERPKRKNPTRNPWFLESVHNGLKATNIREETQTPNRAVPIQYFENDRIFGQGAFETAMKVPDLFKELTDITPKTKGFIFEGHHYLYLNGGILRIRHSDNEEAFFSEPTLRNQSVACYFSYLAKAPEEEAIKTMITELDNAIDQTNTNRARIPYQDNE